MAKGKILVADDDEDILKAISLRLMAQGYEVIGAVDAIQTVMRAMREAPDAAVLDVHMPAGDGVAIVDKLAQHPETSSIPVILITADAQASTRDRAVASGVRYYLTKPFATEDLLDCVEQAIAARHGQDTMAPDIAA